MPLQKGKSKQAFSKNVATEMHEGKPMGQSLAIAYAVKKKAKKKASGGTVASGSKDMSLAEGGKVIYYDERHKEGQVADSTGKKHYFNRSTHDSDHTPKRGEEVHLERKSDKMGDYVHVKKKMANGGRAENEKGVHPADYKGESPAGYDTRHASNPKSSAKRFHREMALDEHRRVLKESRSMPNPKLQGLAKGGSVKGVHKALYGKGGQSDAGNDLMSAKEPYTKSGSAYSVHAQNEAKKKHKEVLEEQRSMPKPRLPMAEGGMIDNKSATTAQRGPKTTRIKHPSMAQSPVFKVRMRDQEDDLQDSAGVNDGPQRQPPQEDNEDGADRQGPQVRDMQGEHSNGRMPYADGGEIDGDDEMDMDHEDSIAAAIMARRDRMHADIDSGAYDMDHAVKMAEGGEILDDNSDLNGADSMDTHEDADQADLSRNADEDMNMEDQASFDAMRKENYSESEGLDELDNPDDSGQHSHEIDKDDHDMVSNIRSKMKSKRQFKAR